MDVPAFRLINFEGYLCAAGEVILGTSVADYKVGEYGCLSVYGLVPIEASGAIAKGDEIAIDRDGKVKSKTSFDTTIGKALDSAPDGGFVRALIPR